MHASFGQQNSWLLHNSIHIHLQWVQVHLELFIFCFHFFPPGKLFSICCTPLLISQCSVSVKVPQIIKILRANSAEGINFTSQILVLITSTTNVAYCAVLGYPIRWISPPCSCIKPFESPPGISYFFCSFSHLAWVHVLQVVQHFLDLLQKELYFASLFIAASVRLSSILCSNFQPEGINIMPREFIFLINITTWKACVIYWSNPKCMCPVLTCHK